ncbi:glycosyltransferase family 4 protein [Polaribacter pectinis]|uniref:Glycosyltransferase family 4 protein n=1 Tax=Polaribacter pectinis TaxID=2738844 RepID=A0A7G9LCC6_9FLAO|nr:glycosyltransferase family 4 protein [Polaribacter pectinis]QNM86275.1 glycosyltransferase family 4 protein [Polaribacter pectinis]
MKKLNILYIGNNLAKKTKYLTTLENLSNQLSKENFNVIISSNKINKVIRLLDMCMSIIKNNNSLDYILIDTYSTTNFYYAFFTSQLSRLFKIKYIPILHGGNLPERIRKSSFLSKKIFENSYKNVAPSNYLKNAFEKEGYSVEYIPNTINIKDYPYKKRKNSKPKLLWVRAFKNIYNPTLAIETLRSLKEAYSEAILCMVGPFSDDSYTETIHLVKKYNLEDSVEFTGVLPKEDWLKKAKDFDIFINTTNFDNTPISVIEAMALGLPVISTNVGGIPFLINDKVDGLLVDKNNEKQMSLAIMAILEDNYSNLADNARKKVENFDWEIVKHKWLNILN